MQLLKTSFLALAILTSSAAANAEEFNQAAEKVQADLELALDKLGSVRENIAIEKIPLLRDVSTLENEVRQKGAELSRLRRLRDNSDLGLNRLREQVESNRAQNEYAAGLLDEFVRSFETRIHYSERQLYESAAEEAKLALEDSDMSQADRFNKQIDVIDVALDRLSDLAGGYNFDGKALAPSGDIVNGKFALYGPSVYFASDSSDLVGVAITKLNAAEAAVANPGNSFTEGIRTFVSQGEGSIPADATLGKALKIVEGNDSILEHFAKGGSVGYVIIALGFICLLVGLLKVQEITKFKAADPEEVLAVLRSVENDDIEAAKSAALMIGGAGSELLLSGLDNMDEKRGTLEEILYEKILSIRPKLERFLPFMALTAASAPLLGLLGTVTGMIKTFNLITIFGTGDAKSLSSGISEALVTTELGLIVAIPSLIMHGLLSRMARQKVGDMEQAAVSFTNGVVAARSKNKE